MNVQLNPIEMKLLEKFRAQVAQLEEMNDEPLSLDGIVELWDSFGRECVKLAMLDADVDHEEDADAWMG
jgi:hypothetical protein